jgi:serine/threonine protein kinase/formylglycine-generating enzyme required for sulfatase activity
MPIKIRPNPTIPDHEVLRKIGGGAYGEVWLARGVTGALRAVKVVWREDFEDARGFEREFEGILKFEPMSRDHPALVNILHVGRSPDGVSFYYYVMELGDDMTSGQEINPIEYEPRTLRADAHQGSGVQWDTNVCIDVGLRLAEALDHLHERGLAHRDVKPSNVIFVNGRAKLADIGLVATRGQRTFVGTEGFVPPEGPGSAQADVYSLGKVLYEIATGKDRLAFPELPDEMPTGIDRKRWLELNKIICDICEPRISKRKISTAADLADALRRLQRGKRRRQSGLAVWMTTLVLAGFVGWASWEMLKNGEWVRSLMPPPPVAAEETGKLRVGSSPEGAEVFDATGHPLGTTPTGFVDVHVGDDYFFTVKKSGFRHATLQGKVPRTVLTEPLALNVALENFSPPLPGGKWTDHLGNLYIPVGEMHESSGFMTKEVWMQFVEATKIPVDAAEFLKFSQNGLPTEVVLATDKMAREFCVWFRDNGYRAGFLTDDHEVRPIVETSFENADLSERARRDSLKPFRIQVRPINYGEITITTDPPGVEVYMNPTSEPENRVSVGYISNTALPIPKVKPGDWQLVLVREGYKPLLLDIQVGEGEKITKSVTLEKSRGVVFGKPWENGIGMHFVPVGSELMVSIWETRVRDYDLFVKETNRESQRPAGFVQTADHPVVNISRKDAQDFCVWLTERERKDERIEQTRFYRLPTDLEWSLMAGLQEEEGISPGWRDARKQRIYPWGIAEPSSGEVVGNLADVTAAATPGVSIDRTIQGYNDGFAYTAPVGSFPANSLGVHDLSGNVQEWVEDEYSKLGKNLLGVLRGGGWNTYQLENLFTGSRNAVPPDFQDVIYGFRVVLAKVPPPKEE